MKNENRIAYSEVYSFIESLPVHEYKKIPKDVVDYINWHREYNYEFKYDQTKTIDEQNISKEAAAMIIKLYSDYFADEDKKKQINNLIHKNEQRKSEEAIEKYNPDNLFKSENNNLEEKSMVECKKENFWIRLGKYIKNVFKK